MRQTRTSDSWRHAAAGEPLWQRPTRTTTLTRVAASAAQPRGGSKDKRKLCASLCNFEYAAQQHLPPSCSALAASGALCEWQLQHSLSVSFRRKLDTASQHGKLAGKSSSDDTVHCCDEYRYQREAGRRYNNRDARKARNELAMEQTRTHTQAQHTPHNTCNGVCVGNGNALVLRCKQKLFSLRKAVKAPRSHTPRSSSTSSPLHISFPSLFREASLEQLEKSAPADRHETSVCAIVSSAHSRSLGSAVVQHQQNSRECGMNGMERGSVKL